MFESFLDYISRTNLFNFIIFAMVIMAIFIKFDIVGMLNNSAKNVADDIEDSNSAKNESEEYLSSVKDSVAHLGEEIDEIIKKSEDNAKLVGEKIISDANNTVENIKTNTSKLVENRTALIRSDILKRASVASIEIAKKQIINELNNNKELHNKLIDESIDAINGVEL